MKTTHTPGPWCEGDENSGNGLNILSASRQIIAHTAEFSSQLSKITGIKSAEAKANAAFIVRACNSHYEMLAALEKVALYGENTGSLSIGHIAALEELGRNARAAIAKAKG
jgi:hypothetical protein